MPWSERDPLRAYIRNQRVVDAQLRRTLLAGANDARRRLRSLDPGTLRRAQLQLAESQLRMWAEIGTVIDDGIRSNAKIVSDLNLAFSDDLLRGLGVRNSAEFKRSMLAQSQNSVRTYLARQNLGMALSGRVYRNGQVASGKIDRIINNAILRGASAREIARDVSAYINPNTPGGVSYAAMRLGRTELSNSFHQSSKETYNANPFVERVEWNLSASHPAADDCDNLVGKYKPDEVPDKPHPQCLCYITPEVMSREQLVSRFKSGEFNDWADGQMTA